MSQILPATAALGLTLCAAFASDFTPAPQHFKQEIAFHFSETNGAPTGAVQLIECASGDVSRAFAGGQWHEFRNGHWSVNTALKPRTAGHFVFPNQQGQPLEVSVPARDVLQLLRGGATNWVVTPQACLMVSEDGKASQLPSPGNRKFRQVALLPHDGLYAATSDGLLAFDGNAWHPVDVRDGLGRAWAVGDVLGVAFDSQVRLWFAVKAGVGCKDAGGWRFYEGKDGLPWNDFTSVTADGDVWFTTHLGVIHFDGKEWQYREGRRWLPNDDVTQAAVDAKGDAWFATAAGVGCIEHQPMTLAEKAELYEQDIERYVKRTPFGYVAEAWLPKPGDKSSANPQDSDNDGLWTSMYGAGECFAYGATGDSKFKERARKAFEALRFLLKVTQGGDHSPPKGYVARTIRSVDLPDPNIGRLERDREEAQRDKLWKVYEPRWPKSADGKWFWKSDTSSDELDGHYFFYPLYYDLCADTETERERVREVVRDVTDHLLTHSFAMIDHDGKPTRWAVYGPQALNNNPLWWQERGIKSLSILCYLAVAEHVTGDPKYAAAARELIDHHGYAQNAMYVKVQHGPGSGNQSDDEMSIMGYFGLLRYTHDAALKDLIRESFYQYWLNEAPELNPFFTFAYAAHNLGATAPNPWGTFSVSPRAGWREDAMATLYGFPLDRFNWSLHNSHRLDVVFLPSVHSQDSESPDEPHRRGNLLNGKVLPIENRHFTHWNTDPWQLDYSGNGNELGAGTVFLLPYYMGLYYKFIEKPGA